MITMRMECAIGVEPMKSTLCRREPWPLGYAHGVAWDGFEPSRGLLQGQVSYQLPDQAEGLGEGGLGKLRPRGSKPLTLTRLRYSPKKWWRWPPERLARRRASEMRRPRNRNTMTGRRGRRTTRTREP